MISSQTTDRRTPQVQAPPGRPPMERLREHKHRFSQSIVFGIPVLVLEWTGYGLGGAESARYVGLFSALLSGWVVYVAGLGLMVEGLLMLRRRVMPDLLISAVAVGVYLLSLVSLVHLFVLGELLIPLLFHWSVILLAAWTGTQWWRLHRVLR